MAALPLLARSLVCSLTLALSLAALAGCGGGSGTSSTRLIGGAATTSGPRAAVPFTTLVKGERSLVTQADVALARNAPQWDAIWARHAGSQAPTAPAPTFPAELGLAIFGGSARGPGASVEVVRLDKDTSNGNVIATVRRFEKGPWNPSTPTTTGTPYHLLSTAATLPGARLSQEVELVLDWDVIDQGSQSQIGSGDPTYAGEVFHLTSARDFASYWALHSSDPLPSIDMAMVDVIAIHAPFQPDFGNSIELRRAVADASALEVRLDWLLHGYRGGAAPPRITETPFIVVRVPKVNATTARAETRAPLPVSETAMSDDALAEATLTVEVARDQASFDAIVARRLPGGYTGRAIDFTREQAVVVIDTQKPTKAYGLSVAKAEILEEGEVDLLIHTHMPLGRPVVIPSTPYQIVTLPRTFGPVTHRVDDVTPRP